MQVGYEFLVGTTPLLLQGIGSIKSPQLKSFMCNEYGEMSYGTYKLYLSTILMQPKNFYIIFGGKEKEWWDEQSDEFKNSQDITNLIPTSPEAKQAYQESLDFFFIDKVKYSEEHNVYITYNGAKDENGNLKATGYIPQDNFKEVCGVIAQLNGIVNDETKDAKPKYKNKLAEKIMNKIKKGQEDRAKKEDKRYSLPNIISAVVSRHSSLNYTNIYELTVTQLYDIFNRLRNNSMLDIGSVSVAVWGDEKNKFDYDSWFKIINN
jgi:hypothetical protein